MRRVTTLTVQEKRDALCNAIRHKCQYSISSYQMAIILESINLNRIYCVKTTTDARKFLNITTEEFVVSSERKVISYIRKLYGNFDYGYFYKSDIMKDHKSAVLYEYRDAAAIKQTITHKKGEPAFMTYTLVIFESGNKAA